MSKQMKNKTTKVIKIKNKEIMENRDIVSDNNLLIDTRDSEGLEVKGGIKNKF